MVPKGVTRNRRTSRRDASSRSSNGGKLTTPFAADLFDLSLAMLAVLVCSKFDACSFLRGAVRHIGESRAGTADGRGVRDGSGLRRDAMSAMTVRFVEMSCFLAPCCSLRIRGVAGFQRGQGARGLWNYEPRQLLQHQNERSTKREPSLYSADKALANSQEVGQRRRPAVTRNREDSLLEPAALFPRVRDVMSVSLPGAGLCRSCSLC